MKGLNVIGPQDQQGIGNAFGMHSKAIWAVHNCMISDVSNIHPQLFPDSYVHGTPRMTELVERAYGKEVFKRGDNIAYWVCESSKLQEEYHTYVDRYETLWTASRYCQRVLYTQLGKVAKVVSHYVDHFDYQPKVNELPVVLMAFDGGSRISRKNPIAGIKAFKHAFGKSKAKLIIKLRNVGNSLRKWIEQEAIGCDYTIIEEFLETEELRKLYARSDVLLSPHKSEGFGLHMLEAMAFGKIVVGSAWGGNLDFMTGDNSYLVPCSEVDVDDDYFKGTWGEPDHDIMVDMLRSSVGDNLFRRQAAFQTALTFSFPRAVRQTQEAL